MRSFIHAWSKKFETEKYPVEFYHYNINKISEANTPEELAKHIIALLHWKDGKVKQDEHGVFLIGHDDHYSMSTTKPNTYSESKHKPVFITERFYKWVQDVKDLNGFDPKKVTDLSDEFQLYSKGAIVIPSFILHIISPMMYPLYDQHVERGKRALLSQNIHFQNRELTLSTYKEYKSLFDDLLKSYDAHTLEDYKVVDSALWSFGRWLKDESQSKKQLLKNEQPEEETYTPSMDFKKEVLRRLGKGESQGNVIRTVALEYGVTLPESYYIYPGSHIHRWKKQMQ